MGSRPLALAALVVAPIVIVVVIVVGWTTWSRQHERRDVEGVAREMRVYEARNSARRAVQDEVAALLSLGALGDDVPAELVEAGPGRGAFPRPSGNPSLLIARIAQQGRDVQAAFARADVRMPRAVLTVSQPLSAADEERALAGETVRGVSAGDFVRALDELGPSASAGSREVRSGPVGRLDDIAASLTWKDPGLLGVLSAILVIVAVWAVLLGRRVRDRIAGADERAKALARRNGRLVALVDASRRMSSAGDVRSVAVTAATEAREVLGADAVAAFLVDGDHAIPVGWAGDPVPRATTTGSGIVGRTLERGVSDRLVESEDPSFPSSGPLAIVAAPLVAGRRIIGALVAVSAGEHLPDEDDELSLRLVALAAAPAIEGAQELHHASTRALVDPLTGLANRHRLDDDLSRLAEDGRAAGLVMVDVDHFKAFNDEHGHVAGDDLLRELGAAVSGAVREGDVVYRYGGEEFCALLRDADHHESRRIAERIRDAVARRDFPGGETQPQGRVTVSVGSAAGPGHAPEELVASADRALYAAKRAGRNRVEAAI